MPDYAGTLQRLALSRTLWLVVAWPLVGLLWQLAVSRRRIARAGDAGAVLRELASARAAGLGCIALTATATLGHALLLARLPVGARALFEPVARGARFGDVDAGVVMLLDPRALAACGLVCAVTLGAGVVLATRPAPERGWRPWAWLQLALAGALVSVLADGFLTVAVGWALASAAGAWLAGWHDPRVGVVAGTRGAAALAAMLVGSALLFWGFGGSWDEDGYTPEVHPRVVTVDVGAVPGQAALTMTSLAGAAVFLDDARVASLHAPFMRATLAPGPHALLIRPGDGADDTVLPRVEAAPGHALALVPLGPTLSFHTMADELSLRDHEGTPVVRHVVEEHLGPGGFAVVAGALLSLLAAAGAMSAWSPPVAAPRVLVAAAAGGTTSVLGPFLLVRLAFLFPSAQHTATVVTSVGAATLLAAVWNALGHTGLRRWLVFVAGAPAGLTCVALGLGDVVAALGVMVVSGAAAAAAYLVAARRGEDDAAIDEAARGSLDDALLARVPARLGELLASMERWVVGSVLSAVGGTARIAAWTLARADEHLVSLPGDTAASRVERAAQTVEPWVGVPLSRVAWALLTLGALATFLHAVWPG
ncbi:MAG TPA: hypothetical protein VGL81_01060 [Polyangiaceae bacterium]|jgi:hypothetical protein